MRVATASFKNFFLYLSSLNSIKKDIRNITSPNVRAIEQSHMDARFATWNS